MNLAAYASETNQALSKNSTHAKYRGQDKTHFVAFITFGNNVLIVKGLNPGVISKVG